MVNAYKIKISRVTLQTCPRDLKFCMVSYLDYIYGKMFIQDLNSRKNAFWDTLPPHRNWDKKYFLYLLKTPYLYKKPDDLVHIQNALKQAQLSC